MPTPTDRPLGRAHRGLRATLVRGLVLSAAVAVTAFGASQPAGAAGPTEWTAPLEPLVVVRGFEPPAGPYSPGHRGVDLAGTADQPVRSAGDGVVTYVGKVAGIGVVVVTHGQIRTTYQPLLGTVRLGAEVTGGDQIGWLTGMGSHCRPAACLHWGAVIGEDYIDPLGLLHPVASRLLPYWDSETGSDARSLAGDASAITTGQVALSAEPVSEPTSEPSSEPTSELALGARTAAADAARRPAPGVASGAASDTVEAGVVRSQRDPDQPMSGRPQHRPLPAGAVAAIAVIGGVVAGAGFLAVRRRRG